MTPAIKDSFLLDPSVMFLNHGSFGACPRPVLESQLAWQHEMERQPVEFLGRRIYDRLAEARAALAAFLGCEADEVVYFPNPTTAINMVARSLDLGPGDEVVATDHEYGAMDRTWRYLCRKTGATYRVQPVHLPLNDPSEVVEALWAGVNDRTRAVFLSHITSPTALILPVADICRRAREAGVLCIVDGAHAPGQIPVDLQALGADVYAGACHKWMCAPKGSGFVYVRKELQDRMEPLIVSWGWEAERPRASTFLDYNEWQGTRDVSAFLAVPEAIRFLREKLTADVRKRCHALAGQARAGLQALTGLPPICPDSPAWYAQMVSHELPVADAEGLQRRLYEERRVEAPIFRWNDRTLIRVSLQAYNTEEDVEALLAGLETLLPDFAAS